jgi:heme A synthase
MSPTMRPNVRKTLLIAFALLVLQGLIGALPATAP